MSARQTPLRTLPAPRSERGFTLIELIAVIVILGILSGIIVERYLDLTNQARQAAYANVAGQGASRFNGAFQKYLLDHGRVPTVLNDLTGSAYLALDGAGRTNIGDYDLVYSQDGGSMTVDVYARSGSTVLGTKTFPWP